MSPEIAKFLQTRNEINWRLAQLINEREVDQDDLSSFCQELTDYLLSGVYSLGIPSSTLAEDFCKKYAKEIGNREAYVQDLSKLTIVLSERWNLEDKHIKKELCI